MRSIERADVLALIERAIHDVGGRAEFSRKYDLSEAYISHVLSGRTPPAKRICAVVGVVPVTEKTWRVK
jgi:hypothetical protein